jgi:hypothetical protein
MLNCGILLFHTITATSSKETLDMAASVVILLSINLIAPNSINAEIIIIIIIIQFYLYKKSIDASEKTIKIIV